MLAYIPDGLCWENSAEDGEDPPRAPQRTRAHHTEGPRHPQRPWENGHVKGHLAKGPAGGEGYFLLKLLNMLFQINGAEKMYLKDYEISFLKRKNMTEGIRTEAVLKSKCLDAQANLEN